MAWIEEQSFFGMEMDWEEQEEYVRAKQMELQNRLESYEHVNAHGFSVDVREIDLKYARNLYHWYHRKVTWINQERLDRTLLVGTLKKRIEDAYLL